MNEFKKLIAVQFSVSYGRVDENIATVNSSLNKSFVENGIVVLPEMWTSGFSYRHLARVSEKSAYVLDFLGEIASERNIFIIGSMPEAVGKKIYNTAFVVDNTGKVSGKYRKVHLFSPMREDKFLKRGNRITLFDSPFGKIGVALCFDLRFPEFIRSMAVAGAKIIAVCAQWPLVRVEHWKTLLRARAIENQCYVVGAAACGKTGSFIFCGNSMIIAPDGEILASAGVKEKIISTDCHMEKVKKIRKDMPCFQSRIPEIYKV